MHSIEQLFGLAPDGGNGMLEALIVMFPFIIAFWMKKRARVSQPRC